MTEENKFASHEYKMETRAQFMSSAHYFVLGGFTVMAFLTVSLFSYGNEPMLIYDESEIYSCPKDWYEEMGKLHRLADNEDFKHDMFNKPQDR